MAVRFRPRLPWAWSVVLGLFAVLMIVELASGRLKPTFGPVGGVLFEVVGVPMMLFLAGVAAAERPRPISLDHVGWSALGLPPITWDEVQSVRTGERSTRYRTLTLLVITVKDPATLAAARVGHSGRLDLGPTRRRAERRQPTVVRVTLPRRFVPRVRTFLEGRPEYSDGRGAGP